MRRRRPVDGEAVRGERARDHHARVEAREQRRDDRDRGHCGHGERAARAPAEDEQGCEDERGDPDRGGHDRREEILVVAVDRDGDRERHERPGEDRGRHRERPGRRLGAVAQVATRSQGEEGRAVEREQRDDRDPGEHGVRAEEVAETAGELAVRVDRDAVDEAREPDSPQQRRPEAGDRVHPRPRCSPPRRLALRPPLERHDPDDEEEENEQEREVEAGEHRRVPGRERREGGAARDDEPDLVAVPYRPDRAERDRPLLVVLRHERQQHADAEVEALEQEVPRPEHRDEDEPERLAGPSVAHRGKRELVAVRRRARAGRRARSGA